MPGMAGQLGGDAQTVRDDGQLTPAAARLEVPGDRERGRAGVQDDAFAIVDEGRRGRADACLLARLQPLADLEGDLRPAAIEGDRAAMRPLQPMLGLEDREILAHGHRRDPEAGGQLLDADAPVFLDHAGDVLLSLAGEDVPQGGAGWFGHASPFDPHGSTKRVSVGSPPHSRLNRNAMSRR